MKVSEAQRIHDVRSLAADGGGAPTMELVEQCRRGNDAAWRTLFDAHAGFVLRVARRLGTPAAELDDVCQEAFMVAFRKLGHFTHGKLTTWLYRITANIVAARHRRRRVREALFAIFGREGRTVATPERLVEQAQVEREVGEVLARMTAAKREVFVLYELEGLSGEEIAERVCIKLDTVWTRLHYARKDFARLARARGLLPGGSG
jgi:RNA polymerase sigma-70 factor (ECF subfamily)